MKPIQFLKPGVFTDMHGSKFTFTPADLAAIAAVYDPALFSSPIVVGHPKDNDPAYGWVRAIKKGNDILEAEPEHIAPEFTEMVSAGRFKKVSASLFPPNHPSNPKPGSYYLRHIGFLGAAAPAIPGLKPVSLADAQKDCVCVEFSIDPESVKKPLSEGELPDGLVDQLKTAFGEKLTERVLTNLNNEKEKDVEKEALEAKQQELKAREAVLSAKEKNLRKQGFAAFVGGLKAEGRVLPALEKGMVEFMESISEVETIEFSEGEKATPLAYFQDYLKKQPKIVPLGEFAGDKNFQPENQNPAKVAEKATKLKDRLQKEGVEISFSEAVERVTGGEE